MSKPARHPDPAIEEAVQSIADEIYGLIAKNHISQDILAKAVDMTQPTLNKRMTGRIMWDVLELYKIAAYFDVPIHELVPVPIYRWNSYIAGESLARIPGQQELPFLGEERDVIDLRDSRHLELV